MACTAGEKKKQWGEEALMRAMYPLLCNPDEHVLSTIGSLVLALLEARQISPSVVFLVLAKRGLQLSWLLACLCLSPISIS